MTEILNKKLKLTAGKSNFKGYGKIIVSDKTFVPGTEYDVEIKVRSIDIPKEQSK